MNIKYEMDNQFCKTPCPNGMPVAVNSQSCKGCDYFEGVNKKYNLVLCNYKKEKMNNVLIIDGKEIKLSAETLEELRKKLVVKETLKWVPEIDEDYFFITKLGSVSSTTWHNNSYDENYLLLGNIFKTEEIAKRKLDDMKDDIAKKFVQIENYVRNNDDGWRADWEDFDQVRYYIYYDYNGKCFDRSMDFRTRNDFTRMSKEMADKILEMLNNEN